MSKNKNNQPIWQNRIKKSSKSMYEKLGSSLAIDKRLYDEDIEAVCSVDKFTLDSEKLSKIPLEKRLVFAMDEYSVYNIFHQSVVDHLSKFNLKGMRFIPVTSWNDNAHFN